jgi:pyrroline-5-carboxylate reductase
MCKVAFIGLGSMGGMLVDGFIRSGGLAAGDIALSTRTKSKLDAAAARWPGVHTALDNAQAAGVAHHVFICVKPMDVKGVLEEILPALKPDAHIVSIAGPVSLASIERLTGRAVTKVGPTVVSEAGGGISLVCHGGKVTVGDAGFVESLLGGIGGVKVLAESEYDLAIELTSCMPGFIASVFREIVDSAVRHSGSLRRGDAEEMVLETLLGTARLMAERGMGFDETIARAATPGGITEEGVKVLRAGLPRVFDELFEKTLEKRRINAERANGQFPIPYIPLMMSHENLAGTPGPGMPAGYSMRFFRAGEEGAWADIVTDAGEFDSPGKALAYFSSHFGERCELLRERCLFLVDASGRLVGTAMGWFMDGDEPVGRLHWVSIKKEHQGKGLCAPLVAEAMRLMHGLGHARALLTTQPQSWKGIRAYLNLGWEPWDDGSEGYREGWALVKRLSGHEALSGF